MIYAVAADEIPSEEERVAVLSKIEEIITATGATSLQDLLLAVAVGLEGLEPELEENRVNILTMHKAKGLSADVVFVMVAEDEVIPQRETARAVDDDRRLLYVSMTRARHRLYLTYASRRTGQQVHTGREPGNPIRRLTRFLRNGPLTPENGTEISIN
jgi:DNA helicase-2/ATP-dependent DNA helicase PcrA